MTAKHTKSVEKNIQSKLDSTTVSSSKEEIILNSTSVNSADTNRRSFVETANDLPDLLHTPNLDGTLVFVKAINMHVVASGTQWLALDGRIYRDDGNYQLWSWGRNAIGNLGDGTTINRSSPVSVVGRITNWCQASAGWFNISGVRCNGTLWAVGDFTGDGTTTARSSPVSVIGGFTDWKTASSSETFTLGLRSNGTLWSWGSNSNGKLGDGTTIDRSSPVSVVGGITDWRQASAGTCHVVALRADGTIWTWGDGSQAALGNNATIDRSSPVSVVGGFTDWKEVGASSYGSFGIRSNGSLWAWGSNYIGQVGDCNTINRSSPVSVVGGFTDWIQATGGFSHSVGLRANGTLWSWGRGNNGRLGDNQFYPPIFSGVSSPVSVVGGFTDWCGVSSGYNTTLAIRSNGTIWGWGENGRGEIGNGNTYAYSSPVQTAGGFTDWCSVSTEQNMVVAIRAPI